MRAALLSSYGFCDRPVFASPALVVEPEGEASTLGQTTDFYSLALGELGGASASVSGVEQQALSAIGGWTHDAQQAVLGLLDPDQTKLLGLAMQGAQIVSGGGGFNEQTFFAVAGLVAAQVGGPVAGALVGSMAVGLQAMGDAFLGVAKLLGLTASAPPAVDSRALCGSFGWVYQGQLIPRGPDDRGDGTYQNPGWQSTWDQVQTIIGPSVDCTGPDISHGLAFVRDRLLSPNLNGILSVSAATDLYPWCELMATYQGHDPTGIGPFLWFFYPLLYTNYDNWYNCNPIPPIPQQSLLSVAAKVWNAAHSDASTATLSPSIDWTFPAPPGMTVQHILGGLDVTAPGGQRPNMGALVIHTGPALAAPATHVVGLRLGGAAAALGADASARAAAAAATQTTAQAPATAGPALGVAAAGGAGYGLWLLLGKPLTVAALRRGWSAVVEELF